jgi:FKBP-type peptidyl-prolyl cis-trans isomerase FkpA
MIKKITIICAVIFTLKSQAQTPNSLIALPSGIKYQILYDARNPKAQIGNIITFNFAYSNDKDSIVLSSYGGGIPQPQAEIAAPQYNGDVMEMFTLLGKGDSAYLLIPVDSMFRQGFTPPFFAAHGMVHMRIKVTDVMTKEAFEKKQQDESMHQGQIDDSIITTYLKQNNLKATKTASGLYYIVRKSDTGAKPSLGMTATVNYTGKLLSGKVFDSNTDPAFGHVQPFDFHVGNGDVIKGWDEGVALMPVGSQYTFILPSTLGYGSHGAGPDIGPNSVLIFDIELVAAKTDAPK